MPTFHGYYKDNRVKSRYMGIDFSMAEALKFADNEGTTIKFYGGTTMGFDHATRGGIRVVSTRANEYAHGLAIEDTITCTKESRKGAFYIYSERPSTSALTTGWGGGEDQLINLTLRNYGVNTGGHGMRGIDLNLRQRSGATTSNMYGILCTIETDSGTDTTGVAYAGRFVTKFSGIHSGTGEQWALIAADESQTADQPAGAGILKVEKQANSNTLDSKYGLRIENDAAAKAIVNAIALSGTITNVIEFEENDGSNGFTAGSGLTQSGNVDGYFTVYDTETGQTLYVNLYDTAPA